jgi:hypothetical protein
VIDALKQMEQLENRLTPGILLEPGANPTIASYNASAVKIYDATSSLVRFENKNIFLYFEKTL